MKTTTFFTAIAVTATMFFASCSSKNVELEKQLSADHAKLEADHKVLEEAHSGMKPNTQHL